MGTTFLEAELALLKADYALHRTGIQSALKSGLMSYTLDTGQDRQTATHFSIAESTRSQQSRLNEIEMLEARLRGSSVVSAAPGW